MGWSFRKGFKFGPFRLNLSKSGLGASFGVKGLRAGIGPKGSYVSAGAKGIYYRQNLSPKTFFDSILEIFNITKNQKVKNETEALNTAELESQKRLELQKQKEIQISKQLESDRANVLNMESKSFRNVCWGMSEYEVKLCLTDEEFKTLTAPVRYYRQPSSFSHPENPKEAMKWTSSLSRTKENDTCINNMLSEAQYEFIDRLPDELSYLKTLKSLFQMLSTKYGTDHIVLSGNLSKILSEDETYAKRICEKPDNKVWIKWEIRDTLVSLFFETRRGRHSLLLSYADSGKTKVKALDLNETISKI
jgi:Protein of unknown function (DUF4236)